MKEITLTRGYVALVDDDKLEYLAGWSWCAKPDGKRVYAMSATDGRDHKVLMHRLLLPCAPGLEVDHIDMNGLNNQMSNLRVATRAQNKIHSHQANKTGWKGVYKHGSGWISQINFSGKRIHIGTFYTPEEAARAYDAKAMELFREFARLNFPQTMPSVIAKHLAEKQAQPA